MQAIPDVQHAYEAAVMYPESDGQPMAENTEQFRWIVMIKENLEALFQENPQVFVAGDLFWYPRQGDTDLRRAPDTLVVFGRPKGRRGSYRQWEEDNIAPQVVVEILSPSNTMTEMAEKFEFYDLYGVEEYYLYDPEDHELTGWQRQDTRLRLISGIDGWVSPRLGVRFVLSRGAELQLFRPDGQPFLSFSEMERQRNAERTARQEAEAQRNAERTARQEAEAQRNAERTARQEAEAQRNAERTARQEAEARAAHLAARLRELGMDPEA